ncbi:cysteine desulfurase family protein [Aurantivibrio infirmus]
MNKPIYLDYAATTPVDPRVAEAMSECLTLEGVFANAASRSHIYGWQAEEKVEEARCDLADFLNCDPREVIWTSGATESDNLALKGVFEAQEFSGHLITSEIEHKAIIDTAKYLETRGVEVTWLRPNADGLILAADVETAIKEDTRLVSLMFVNNETGVINPIEEIARICRQAEVLFHVDAAQALGRISFSLEKIPVDLMSFSAHKFYGPKGVGALFVRRSAHHQVKAQIHGGGHERGLRSGTLPTHQIVGMGKAVKLLAESLDEEIAKTIELRDLLWRGISTLPGLRRNGHPDHLSPGHLNVCFSGLEGENLLLSLRELAISSGSACTSASTSPSYVLKAMGLNDQDALSSLRISLGRFTTRDDIDRAIRHICDTIQRLQASEKSAAR